MKVGIQLDNLLKLMVRPMISLTHQLAKHELKQRNDRQKSTVLLAPQQLVAINESIMQYYVRIPFPTPQRAVRRQ
jgi:hypothetical protein